MATQVSLAHQEAVEKLEKSEKGYFFDDDTVVEFRLGDCCNSDVHFHQEPFKTMREPPNRKGILGVGIVRKLEEIGTVVLQIIDSKGG
eukprot:6909472-Ditylum_brightwellii.AAC.1